MHSEFQLIEKIKKWIPRNLQGPLGIGDDAAVIDGVSGEQWVVTADTLVEDVDFYLRRKKKSPGFVSAEDAGRKALAVNLSDLAAMGASAKVCVISLGVPKGMDTQWLKTFYSGVVRLAREFNVLCAGGDISAAKEFFVSITALGAVKKGRAVTRSGARPGDWIGVTGCLGGSLIKKHFSFIPRLRESSFLVSSFKLNSMIDISDGLLQDLGHILQSSNVGADLEMCELPISPDAVRLAKQDPMKSFERACADGEDFELLFTVPAGSKAEIDRKWKQRFAKVPLSWIGRITPKPRQIRWTCGEKFVKPFKLKRAGYQHFF